MPLPTAKRVNSTGCPFQLLPEAVAVQRVTGDARTYHRHQRQPLTQTKLARQARFIRIFSALSATSAV